MSYYIRNGVQTIDQLTYVHTKIVLKYTFISFFETHKVIYRKIMLNTRFRNGGIRGAGGVPGQHRKCVEDLGQYCTISGAGFGALGTEICRF